MTAETSAPVAAPAAPAAAKPAAPPAPAAPAAPKGPVVFKHEGMPDWGPGLVVQDLPQHWVIFFEKAGEKKFVKDKAKVLVPVTLEEGALKSLTVKALGRKPRAAPTASLKPGQKKPAAKKTARFLTFKDQVAAFEKIFVGGFTGERFVKEERGGEETKEAAIALAQKELSKEAFAGPTEAVFESAKKLLKATNIVFPIEGAIPFGQLTGDAQKKAIDGLKELLHGTGDYAERLEKFTAALELKDKNGPKKVTWPLATVFGALFNPKEWVAVKPTAFASQAATIGLQVEKSQPVKAEGYQQFANVVAKTKEMLVAAGHQPRDLMDVFSFISRTHSEKQEG